MKTVILAIGLLAVFAGILICLRQFCAEKPPPIVVTSQGPTIERLERVSTLVASRVYVADVLIGEGSGCRGAFLIRGDALLAIPLDKAGDRQGRVRKACTIRLPPPEVLQARVDHSRTKTWEVKTTTWIPFGTDQDALRDEVMHQAQLMVAQAAGSKENIEQAKRSAEAIIGALYEHVGSTVQTVWQECAERSSCGRDTVSADTQIDHLT